MIGDSLLKQIEFIKEIDKIMRQNLPSAMFRRKVVANIKRELWCVGFA